MLVRGADFSSCYLPPQVLLCFSEERSLRSFSRICRLLFSGTRRIGFPNSLLTRSDSPEASKCPHFNFIVVLEAPVLGTAAIIVKVLYR